MRIYVEADSKCALRDIARAWGAAVRRDSSSRDLRKAIAAAYFRAADADDRRAAQARKAAEGRQ